MYTRSKVPLPPIPSSPEEEDEFDDAISEISTASWKSGVTQKSMSYSSAASLNNNHPQTRPTTSGTHHHATCHKHRQGHHSCSCIKVFYEDDEVCRMSGRGRLEFGIVSKQGRKLKILWTIGGNVEEQDIDEEDEGIENIRLIDRKCVPGDVIHVNKKKGEVEDVSWVCHAQVIENNICLLNIPCENLEPLLPNYPGQKIEYSGWVGTITTVSTEATLMFTGIGRTGIVDCSCLPMRQQPYPGRKVKYTLNQYVEAKLRFLDDTRTISQVFKGQVIIEAFVLFLNVTEVEVRWNGRVRNGVNRKASEVVVGSNPPPTTLTKTNLKRQANVLGTIKDVDWELCHDAVEKYFQYTAKESDSVVPTGGIEEYMRVRYFDEEEKQCLTVKNVKGKGAKICTNVAYNVKVLRFCRVIKVKWSQSGKVEKISSSQVTEKRSFSQPYHQIVQKSLTLAPYSYDTYGVTLSSNEHDVVLVQWVSKSRDNASNSKFTFTPTYQTPEPTFNLEPHFAYGGITPREIVYRSVYCRIPEALFTLGWVRSVTSQGQVVVVSVHSKQEHLFYPLELESTGLKLDEVTSEGNDKFKVSRYTDLVKVHGLNTLRSADKLFVQMISIQDMNYFPDHFVLMPKCPTTHTFYKNSFSVRSDGTWMRAVKKDQLFLTTRMNDEIGSIWIKGFRDRLDLFSVLLAAPPGTPYEGGLFALDLQLVPEYPCSPPAIYLHTSAGLLRPGTQNLELQDNVMAPHSLVESLIALQCKLFTSKDPFEIPSSAASLARRTILTKDNEDRQLNARVIIDVLDLMFRTVMDPPKLWSTEVVNYFHMTFERTKDRLMGLLDMTSNPFSNCSDDWIMPTFPLLPVTDGFTEAVLTRLKRFEDLIEQSLE